MTMSTKGKVDEDRKRGISNLFSFNVHERFFSVDVKPVSLHPVYNCYLIISSLKNGRSVFFINSKLAHLAGHSLKSEAN